MSLSAAAQFPLGSTMPEIKAYVDSNVPYATAQEFQAKSGDSAICFTKVKVVGDFTFYFDHNGVCSSYVVTSDKREAGDVVYMLDHKYCKLESTRWVSETGTFDAVLLPAKAGANYISIVYTAISATPRANILAAN